MARINALQLDPEYVCFRRLKKNTDFISSILIPDRRFGTRKRHYLTHFGKTLSMPLLKEAYQMWPEEFATVS